ncbi:MAG: hypothetical protein E6X49_02740 [Leclercia adecarboxylata]|nr:hypothetical protein [uncultured Leclercia sp.]MDU4840048.1 hypothetical protein [Leclercia adecarboxylata]
MDGKINTEAYCFCGDDGYLYMHFPIRGFAFKTHVENQALVHKLIQRSTLTAQEYRHPLVSELQKKD